MEGDDVSSEFALFHIPISIHSLRMEGDLCTCPPPAAQQNFNPLPPHGGRLISTHPTLCSRQYFNPLPPHGGRRYITGRVSGKIAFQSTPSAWRETRPHTISVAQYCYFNPLPPHGGRPAKDGGYSADFAFQSTPSAWRETAVGGNGAGQHTISIHSLRMEGDSKTAQESVFHFAYPCTILQKRMQKTTFCTRKNDFFRKKGEKFGAKPPASFCAPMIRTDIFPQTSLTESAALPCLWFPLHRYVPPSTDNDFPGNKTAGCPFLYQSPVPADA